MKKVIIIVGVLVFVAILGIYFGFMRMASATQLCNKMIYLARTELASQTGVDPLTLSEKELIGTDLQGCVRKEEFAEKSGRAGLLKRKKYRDCVMKSKTMEDASTCIK